MTTKPRSEISKAKSLEPALPEPPLSRGSVADQMFIKLRDQILQGSLPRGTKLPSERELAQRLGIELAYEDTRGDFANWLKVGGKLGADRRKLVEAIKNRDLERATRAATQYHQHTKSLVRDRAATNKRDGTARMQRAFVRMRERGLLS